LIFLGLGDTQALTLTIVDRSISWISIIVIGGTLFVSWQTFVVRRCERGNGQPLIGSAEDAGGSEPMVIDTD
jgi:hypothetical protein